MPSVQLILLREQLVHLFGLVDRPEDFQRALNDLLDKYSEHALRSGETVLPRSLLPSYHTPALVYRQLELELATACKRQPEQLLGVAQTLWSDEHLEPRLLAALILGQLPRAYAGAVTERLRAWADPRADRLVLTELLDRGGAMLRASAPEAFLGLVQAWLEDKRIAYQQMGLRTLEAFIQDPTYENLPAIFNLITPLVMAPPASLAGYLYGCLQALAHKSPGETAYFLRQSLGVSVNRSTARLVRRALADFPVSFQQGLRDALRSHARA
jgi:hypothetical protein